MNQATEALAKALEDLHDDEMATAADHLRCVAASIDKGYRPVLVEALAHVNVKLCGCPDPSLDDFSVAEVVDYFDTRDLVERLLEADKDGVIKVLKEEGVLSA